MENNLTWLRVWWHLIISLVPLIIVLLAGGGISYLFVTFFKRWFERHPRTAEFMVLFPWRSIAIFVALVIINTPLIMIEKFGLGPEASIASNGTALIALFIPYTIHAFLSSWHPKSLRSNLFSVSRTFTLLAFSFPVFLAGGLGLFIDQAVSDLEYQKVIQGYLIIGGILLAVDLVIGLIQLLFDHPGRTTS